MIEEKQQIFNEFMKEYKKLDISQKQDELVEKLQSIMAYLNLYAVNNNIEFTPIKSYEIKDLNNNPTIDDYLEAMMVYCQNIEELMGLILLFTNN